jgi:hypothetical protein
MTKACILLLISIPFMTAGAQIDFDRFFIDRTMRIDYFHTGTKDKESMTLDRVFEEGAWPGSTVNLVDTLNLGEFLLRAFDVQSGMLIYSRGFSSYFNEWQTTDEALKGVSKTISETVRIPFPKHPVQVTISRRDKKMIFHETWSTVINPNDPVQVNREKRFPGYKVVDLIKNGDPHKKVDILIVGDGYTKEEQDKFLEDARHFNDVMFNTKPFNERKRDFNVRAMCVVSQESGIDKPDANIWKNTALCTNYNTFGSERYVLTEANRELRDIAGGAPYDFITILLNDKRYGGGGIYQLYTTTYTIAEAPEMAWQRDYVYVHEFGHSFGGLGDEYYTSSTGYNDFYPADVEPWEPNITRLFDPGSLKWKQLVSEGVPVPTQWNKPRYDSISTMRVSLRPADGDYKSARMKLMEEMKSITKNPQLLGKVGAFEGAGYVATGMYRPSLDCRMFSLSLTDFDPVCMKAIERQIDFYAQ